MGDSMKENVKKLLFNRSVTLDIQCDPDHEFDITINGENILEQIKYHRLCLEDHFKQDRWDIDLDHSFLDIIQNVLGFDPFIIKAKIIEGLNCDYVHKYNTGYAVYRPIKVWYDTKKDILVNSRKDKNTERYELIGDLE